MSKTCVLSFSLIAILLVGCSAKPFDEFLALPLDKKIASCNSLPPSIHPHGSTLFTPQLTSFGRSVYSYCCNYNLFKNKKFYVDCPIQNIKRKIK